MRSVVLLSLTATVVALLSFSLLGVSAPGVSASGSSPYASHLAEDAVIILKNGTELSGSIIKETDEVVTLKSEFGVVNIKRKEIKEIRRPEGSGKPKKDKKPDKKKPDKNKDDENEEGNAGDSDGKEPEKKPSTKGKTRVKPREPTEAETEARQKELVKRKKELEKFRKQREREREGVPWERHHVLKSNNYIIHCNSTKAVASRYMWIMEALSNELRKRITKKPHNTRRSDVHIYRSAEEFRQQTGSGALGFYSPSSKQIHAFHGTFGATGSTLGVLGHEGTHQIQDKVHPQIWNMTPWIREGMAVYYGDEAKLDYKKKKVIIGKIPRDRLFHIQRKMKNNDYSRLKELCKIPQRAFGGTYYSDAWALVYYLLHSDDKDKGRRFFVEYWERSYTKALTQRDFTELADKYFGSLEKMEKRYIDYILSLKAGPAGEVKEEYFTSDQFMLEIKRPTPDYEWSLAGEINGYLVGMKIPKTETQLELVFRTNDELKEPDEYLAEFKGNPEVKRLYGKVEAKPMTLAGCEAFMLTFEDRKASAEAEGEAGSNKPKPPKPPQPKPEPVQKKDGKPEVAKKHRWFLIFYDKNVYQLRCAAAEKEFDEYEYDFDYAARSFDLILKVRW